MRWMAAKRRQPDVAVPSGQTASGPANPSIMRCKLVGRQGFEPWTLGLKVRLSPYQHLPWFSVQALHVGVHWP